jgi:hypothetical protein
MLYADCTVTHLIVDYLIENQFLEKRTFAKRHHLEASEKDIQVCLTNLVKRDGIVNFIEMRPEKFKQDYGTRTGLPLEVVSDKIEADKKIQVYYFNVDLKFILKARMFLLKKAFETNT